MDVTAIFPGTKGGDVEWDGAVTVATMHEGMKDWGITYNANYNAQEDYTLSGPRQRTTGGHFTAILYLSWVFFWCKHMQPRWEMFSPAMSCCGGGGGGAARHEKPASLLRLFCFYQLSDNLIQTFSSMGCTEHRTCKYSHSLQIWPLGTSLTVL